MFQFGLEATNPLVRKESVKALGVLYTFVGSRLREFVSDFKPALLATIDKEFERVKGQKPEEPTRTLKKKSSTSGSGSSSRGNSAPSSSSSSNGGASTSAPSSSGFEIPREDISGLITPTLLSQLGNKNWKLRQEGLANVNAIIDDAHHAVGPNLGDLIPALKARLTDSNKNLVAMTVQLLGVLAAAVGKPIERYSKLILSNITQVRHRY